MRAREFMEGKVLANTPLTKSSSDSMPTARTYPEMLGHYYDMYRFGVAAAVSPDMEHDFPRQSVGPAMMTLQYSKADTEILNRAEKIMGVKGKGINAQGSNEVKDVHTMSPVAKRKKNRYGV
jgi:hypothetical protein